MRILHLSAYDLMGGAPKAAFRLHRALVDAGEDSLMLVRQKDSDRADVIGPEGWLQRVVTKAQRRAERLLVMPRTTGEFSVGSLPDGLLKRVRALRPDVIHVHWVSHGFLRLETLAKLGLPVVWTMHDMWAFTGGCHYAGACNRYAEGCGCCPMLVDSGKRDASYHGVQRRQLLRTGANITWVAPSGWMAACARASATLGSSNVRVIPNTIETAVFAPRDRLAARQKLGLDGGRFIILSGSAGAGKRKGWPELLEAMRIFSLTKGPGMNPLLMIFGTPERREYKEQGLTVRELGYITKENDLVDVYAAADVFVAPSKEDNLPNTVMEAMAVGIPVIGSRVGGIPDMVDDNLNGILVTQGDVGNIAEAMARLLSDDAIRLAMGRAAREKVVQSYSPAVVTAAYRALYTECGVRP